MFCLVLPGGRPGPRFFSDESCLLVKLGAMAVLVGVVTVVKGRFETRDGATDELLRALFDLDSDFFRWRPAKQQAKMSC